MCMLSNQSQSDISILSFGVFHFATFSKIDLNIIYDLSILNFNYCIFLFKFLKIYLLGEVGSLAQAVSRPSWSGPNHLLGAKGHGPHRKILSFREKKEFFHLRSFIGSFIRAQKVFDLTRIAFTSRFRSCLLAEKFSFSRRHKIAIGHFYYGWLPSNPMAPHGVVFLS